MMHIYPPYNLEWRRKETGDTLSPPVCGCSKRG